MVNFKGKEPMPDEGSRLPSNPWSLPMVSNGEGAGPFNSRRPVERDNLPHTQVDDSHRRNHVDQEEDVLMAKLN